MKLSAIWKCRALKVANFQERRVLGGGILGGTGDILVNSDGYLLDLSNHPVGFYTCKISKDGKSVFADKIVIAR